MPIVLTQYYHSYDPELVATAGLAKLRSTASAPTEQVELELTVAGSQVTDYAWYSADYTLPPAAVSASAGGLTNCSRCTFEMQCKAADDPGDCHWCPMPVGHGGKSYCEVNGTVCPRHTTDPVDQSKPSKQSLAVFTCEPSASWQLWSLVPIAKWSKKVALQSVADAKLCVTITDEQYDGGNGTALVPCDEADPKQQWQTGLDGTHIEGAGNLCLDVQDADTKDGANVKFTSNRPLACD